MTRRGALVALLLVAAAALALPAVAQDGDQTGEVENVTVGQEVSAFMQSAEANAHGEVENGMFDARMESANASERAAVVEERTDEIAARVDAIEERIEELRANRTDVNPVAYRAQMSAAAAQLAAVRESANRTATHAERVGVDTTRLETLRNNASELTGQEVAAIARSLAGVMGRGPPDHAGPPGGNGTEPPDNAGPPGGNGTDSTGGDPPDDTGQGTDNGQGTGAGPGEATGDGGPFGK